LPGQALPGCAADWYKTGCLLWLRRFVRRSALGSAPREYRGHCAVLDRCGAVCAFRARNLWMLSRIVPWLLHQEVDLQRGDHQLGFACASALEAYRIR